MKLLMLLGSNRFFSNAGNSFSRMVLLVGVLGFTMLGSGCVSVKQYVDPALPKVAFEDLLKNPSKQEKQPVQVMIEFRTKGIVNARATEAVTPLVIKTLQQSSLFSDVLTGQATSGNKLFITIDNIVVDKDAFSKGFATGLTLGLAGSMVTDGYVMNASYITPNKDEFKHVYKHAIHSTIGNAEGPKGLTPVPKEPKDEAIRQVVEGLILNLLNDMQKNGEMNK
ncbi:hypothetical protein H8L32_25555 [Undibacterium sp. CY18W]|uniref:Lipoprotein n=1 Tax=Undibacterium hunanense TaxID=2762292 RepID=A0ABR6ZY97_9BURK|nr:hypothetical protein [Undibacterium hunanense]MBC3920856.1 hypothetical protein [Undibacterium hunanense]